MLSKIGFQTKIYLAVIFVLLVAMLTSYFSVNYSVGNYIYNNDTLNITNNTALVENNIATQIQAKIDLSTNMSVSITAIKKVQEGAGFMRIYKVLNGLVFSATGSVDDQTEAEKLFTIGKITQQSKERFLISDVEQLMVKM